MPLAETLQTLEDHIAGGPFEHDDFQADLKSLIQQAKKELSELNEELDTERNRLAACGVVANSNTPSSLEEAKKMAPKYQSASCNDVIATVEENIQLRQELQATQAALQSTQSAKSSSLRNSLVLLDIALNLGLSRDCTPEDIRKEVRALMAKYTRSSSPFMYYVKDKEGYIRELPNYYTKEMEENAEAVGAKLVPVYLAPVKETPEIDTPSEIRMFLKDYARRVDFARSENLPDLDDRYVLLAKDLIAAFEGYHCNKKLRLAAQIPETLFQAGALVTLNQDPYPDLGEWWNQIWIYGGNVYARVYGDSVEETSARTKHVTDLLNAHKLNKDKPENG